MNTLTSIFIAEVISLAGVLVAWATYLRISKEKREAKIANEAIFRADMQALKTDFKKETGGNSGGLREAINAIRVTQIEMTGKYDVTSQALHRLEGAFEQHILMHQKG